MSEPTITGSVAVEVVPDASQWASRLRAAILRDADKMGKEFGKALGSAAGDVIADGVEDGIERGTRAGGRSSEREGAQTGGKFAAGFRKAVEAALKNLPVADVDLDADPARRELAAIRAEMAALADLTIGVDLDAATARARLADLQQRLRTLAASDVDVDVRVDAAAAAASVAAFDAQVDRLDGRQADVQVDVDTSRARADLDQMSLSGNIASGRILGMVAAFALLGATAGPILAVAAAGVLSIGTAAAAAATGVGVLAFALAPVIAATQGVVQEQNRAATSAGQAQSRALALAGAQDSLRAALRGVASAHLDAAQAAERSSRRIEDAQSGLRAAYEDAAEAAEDSARRVADAERSVEDARRDAGFAATTSARRIEDAERAVSDAQRDARLAQEDLTEARKDAIRTAEDLAERVEDLGRSERDAQLDILEAKKRLDQANADPRISDLQRQRAQLAYEEALDRLDDVRTSQQRAAEDKAESDAKGVEGSDQVADALRRVEDAGRSVADAQRSLQDAQEASARQAQESARRIGDAERGLADARTDQARSAVDAQRRIEDAQKSVAEAQRDAADQARRSAEAIASAQQAVVNAQRGVEAASVRAGTAGGAAAETLRRKLAELAPEGRVFVAFLTSEFLPAMRELSRDAQAGFLPGLQSGLDSFLQSGPLVSEVVTDISKALGDMARDAGAAFTSPFWQDFLRFARDEFPPTLATLGRIFGNLAAAGAGLIIAFDPVTDRVLGAVEGLSSRLRDLVTDTDPDSPIQRFIAWLLENGPIAAEALGDVAGAVLDIIVAVAPLGVAVLEGLGGLARFISDLPPEVLRTFALGIGLVAGAMGVLNFVLSAAALGTPGLVAAGIALLGTAAATAYAEFEPFREIVNEVWGALQDAARTVRDEAGPELDALGRAVRDDLGPAFGDLLGAVGPLVALLIRDLGPIVAILVQNHLRKLLLIVEGVGLAFRALTLQAEVFTGLLKFFGIDVEAAGTNITGMGDASGDAARKVDDLKEAQRKAADEARRLADNTLSLRDSENRYEEALDRSRTALKDNGETLDVHTEKGRRNRDALDQIAESANAFTQELTDNGAAEDVIQRKMEETRNKLIQAGIRFGLTKDEAKRYADQVLKVPTKQETKVSTPGAPAAKAQVEAFTKANKDAASQAGTTQRAITTAWTVLKELAKAPIRFVINTVMGGLARGFNSLSSKIGGPTLPVPSAGFAAGGVLPGYTPGRDVHEFFSPTAGMLALSGGEAIMRPEFTRAVGGSAGVAELNRMAREGAPLMEMFGARRFADGGIIDFIKSKAAASWDWVLDKGSDLSRGFANPGQFLGGITIPGSGTGFRSLAASAGSTLKDGLVSKIGSLFSSFKSAFDQSGVGGFPAGGGIGMGYQAMAEWVRKYLPGVAITSTYRPGAVTSSGNTSYHALGRAIDLAPSMDTFNKIKKSYGSSIRELIYTPAGPAQVKNGQPYTYTGAVAAAHNNHVHFAMKDGGVIPPVKYDAGGWIPTGVTNVMNATGRPEAVLTGAQWDALRSRPNGMQIGALTIQMPTTAGTLDMLSPADRIRAARSIHEEIQKLDGARL